MSLMVSILGISEPNDEEWAGENITGDDGNHVRRSACLGEGTGTNKIIEM